MRKATIVFLAVILLVSACFVSLHCVYLEVSDDVTVTRQTLYGDPSVAEGVNILVRNQYDQHLMWETALTLDGDPAPETEFTFTNEGIAMFNEVEPDGVRFSVMSDVFAISNLHRLMEFEGKKHALEKYNALIDAVNAAIDAVPEGEEQAFTIDFTAYLDYYPLAGQVILPEMAISFSEFEFWPDEYADFAEVVCAINEFFRIPVDGKFNVEYFIDKTNSKNSSYGAYIEMDYSMNASGVATENACYFTFNTLRDDGAVVDTSLIPGGYGLYCLPYDENGLKLDAIEMVFPLDPAEAYDSMQLSADGKRIRLRTWDGDDLMLTVIDLATMTQLQRVKLLTASEEWNYNVIGYDDFALIVEDRRNSDSMDRITVWEELADGSWACAFTVETNRTVLPNTTLNDLFGRNNNAVDYQDGKLVVITHQNVAWDIYLYDNYCDLYVAVYDATGMVYAGTCEWNLSRINSLYPNTVRVEPTYKESLEVSW